METNLEAMARNADLIATYTRALLRQYADLTAAGMLALSRGNTEASLAASHEAAHIENMICHLAATQDTTDAADWLSQSQEAQP